MRVVRVRVKLHGETKRGVPGLRGDNVEGETRDGLTVTEVLAELGVDLSEVWLNAVNGQLVKGDHIVNDGDAIEVFAPVAGG
jgi:sulfur carrier protein ThiS